MAANSGAFYASVSHRNVISFFIFTLRYEAQLIIGFTTIFSVELRQNWDIDTLISRSYASFTLGPITYLFTTVNLSISTKPLSWRH